MSCRCGQPPAKRCASCAGDIDPEINACRKHPALDIDAVRCAKCGLQLCAFHYSLMPMSKAGGGIGLVPICFPGCESTFGARVVISNGAPRHRGLRS